MAKRTYLPTLIRTVRTLCIYITRYDIIIREFLPEGSETAYDALKAACNLFLEKVTEDPFE